jgi:hypothetical protein
VTARALAALGVRTGPVHAELRLAPSGPLVIEVALRTIGGLCSRALRFGMGLSLEELVITNALGRLAVWVVELPVDVALARDVGAGIATAHRHDHVGPLRVSAAEPAGDAVRDIDVELAHHPYDLAVHPRGRVRARGARGVRAGRGAVEEGARDLRATGVLDADEQDVHAGTAGRTRSAILSRTPGCSE